MHDASFKARVGLEGVGRENVQKIQNTGQNFAAFSLVTVFVQ